MKSYIIYLKDNEFSCRIADECVTQASRFGLDVTHFAGYTGQQANALFEQDGIYQFPKKLKKITAGIKGCAASHYALWKACVEDDVPYLILEQDAYMIRPLPNILDSFDHVCKLDSANPFADDYSQQVQLDHGNRIVSYDLSWGYKKHAAPYGGYFRGAWAYVIKPQAAKICVDSFKNYGWLPADKQFGEQLLDLKCLSSTIFRIHPEYTADNIESLSLTRNLR